MEGPPFTYGDTDDGLGLNYWTMNPVLQRAAARVYPDAEFEWAEEHLQEFGEIVGTHIAPNADQIDAHPPTLQTYDKHGELFNHVEYHPAQHENETLIYERGIVADAFTPPPDRDEPVGLIHTLILQLLLAYADTGLVCSQSMTTGVALVLDTHDERNRYQPIFDQLTTRDPTTISEGAMFLTEEHGGNDVGANETTAEPVDHPSDHPPSYPNPNDDHHRTFALSGEKWFCSNLDAQATLALARRAGAQNGTGGLSLFLVPHELPDGSLNNQRYRRLKDKLGTKSVPTGEVEFDETTGYLVGEPERGFKYMTTMLNWERVTNAVGAVGIIGRLLLESKIHAANREAFGNPIQEYPLMQRDLAEMVVDHEATLAFAVETSRWFDRTYREDSSSRAYKLMRLLVPVAKHVTTRTAVETASYAMEIHGGNGYVSDFITHRLYRDVQALPIWEGTANILALDVLRTMDRDAAHEALLPLIESQLEAVTHPYLVELQSTIEPHVEQLQTALLTLAAADVDYAQHEAKTLTEYLYDVVTATLLLHDAQTRINAGDARKTVIAELFIRDAFSTETGRGIDDEVALPMQFFDAITAYATIDPAELPETPTI